MKPIPLTTPGGIVAAYMCSICHHIPITGEYLVRMPIGFQAEESLRDARRCCRCHTCHRPLRKAEGRTSTCDRCRKEHQAKMLAASLAAPPLPPPRMSETDQNTALKRVLERWGVDWEDLDAAGLEVLALVAGGVARAGAEG